MTAAPFVFEPLETRGELLVSGNPADRAAEIVAEATAAAAEIEAQARIVGFEAGRLEGIAAAEQELEQLRATLSSVVDGVAGARDEFVQAAELHAIELAVAIAEKIVGTALAVDPARVCDVVAGALRRVADHDRLVLELSPDDIDVVRAWLDAGEASFWGTIDLRAERRVQPGGCVVRTSEGEVDARLSEQLVAAEAVLRETLAGNAE